VTSAAAASSQIQRCTSARWQAWPALLKISSAMPWLAHARPPIAGATGNREFFLHIRPSGDSLPAERREANDSGRHTGAGDMKTIGVIVRPGVASAEAGPVLAELVEFLRKRGRSVLIERHAAALVPALGSGRRTIADAPEIGARADALVVLGGDGTLLAASHLIEREDVPLIGVNFGSLGFLTEITLAELHPVLERVALGQLTRTRRGACCAPRSVALVRATTTARSAAMCSTTWSSQRPAPLSRIIELEVRVDGAFVSSFRADGLIRGVADRLPAYNLAVGGPILHTLLWPPFRRHRDLASCAQQPAAGAG